MTWNSQKSCEEMALQSVHWIKGRLTRETHHPCMESMRAAWCMQFLTSSPSQEGACVSSLSQQQCCIPLFSIYPAEKRQHIHTTGLCGLQGASWPLAAMHALTTWATRNNMGRMCALNTYIIGQIDEIFQEPWHHSNIINCQGGEEHGLGEGRRRTSYIPQ